MQEAIKQVLVDEMLTKYCSLFADGEMCCSQWTEEG